MAYISKIKLPNNITYDIKDANALPLTGGDISGGLTVGPIELDGTNIYIDDCGYFSTLYGSLTFDDEGATLLYDDTYGLKIYPDGEIRISGDSLTSENAVTLGKATKRWGTIYGTDENLTGALTAASIIKSGGTSSQFLKADGSVDSNSYLTGTGIASIVAISESDYEALAIKNPTTLYIVTPDTN